VDFFNLARAGRKLGGAPLKVTPPVGVVAPEVKSKDQV
jgi:hypothetical protein